MKSVYICIGFMEVHVLQSVDCLLVADPEDADYTLPHAGAAILSNHGSFSSFYGDLLQRSLNRDRDCIFINANCSVAYR